MNLVIEEINRAKKVIQRYQLKDKSCIRIGRALDNDIILSEPHVSPYHMELILNEDDQWTVVDLNSVNGVRNHARKKVENGTVVESGDTFLLGRAYISIWRDDHPVEKTWPLHSVEDVFHAISSPWLLVLLLGAYIFGEWQIAVIHNYLKLAPSKIVNDLIYQLLIVVGWATAWSLSGRVIRHESRFYSHLAVTLMAAIILQWAPLVVRILAFNGSYGLWLSEIRYFINGAVFSLLLWSNFYLSMPQKPVVRIIWSNALAWGVVLIYLLPPIFDAQSFRGYPLYDATLLPPSVFWADTVTADDFVSDVEFLYGDFEPEVLEKQEPKTEAPTTEVSTSPEKNQTELIN